MTENLILSLISIGFLILALFWLFRDYEVDRFRQQMFKLRDDLFDDAANNKLPFDSEGYCILRNTMNGSIRFGHRINLTHVMLFYFMSRKHYAQRISFTETLNEAIEKLTSEQQVLIRQYHSQMNKITIKHMVLSSPLLFICISIYAGIAFTFRATRQLIDSYFSRKISVSIDQLGNVAFRATSQLKDSYLSRKLSEPIDQLDNAALLTGKH